MRLNSFFRVSFCSLFAISFIFLFSCNDTSKSESEVVTDTTKITTVDTTTPSTPTKTDTISLPVKVDTMPALKVKHVEAVLSGTYTDTLVEGTVKFDTVSGDRVRMILDVKIPSKAGKIVSLHIHEHGDCGDKGNMAHDHWNPSNTEHGKWGTSSFHAGDIGNVKLNAQGKGTLTLITNLWTLGGSPAKNVIGKSIIVHGAMDDYKTQPGGNSGPRIGCGVIK